MNFLKYSTQKNLNYLDLNPELDQGKTKKRKKWQKGQIGPSWDLNQHLEQEDLYQDLKINHSGSLTFHWADWFETCIIQSHLSSNNVIHSKRMDGLKDNIEMLKST